MHGNQCMFLIKSMFNCAQILDKFWKYCVYEQFLAFASILNWFRLLIIINALSIAYTRFNVFEKISILFWYKFRFLIDTVGFDFLGLVSTALYRECYLSSEAGHIFFCFVSFLWRLCHSMCNFKIECDFYFSFVWFVGMLARWRHRNW